MKLATIAAILGVGQAVDIKQPSEALESLIQEAENMEEVCKDMDTIDESSLLEAEEDIELEKKHYMFCKCRRQKMSKLGLNYKTGRQTYGTR